MLWKSIECWKKYGFCYSLFFVNDKFLENRLHVPDSPKWKFDVAWIRQECHKNPYTRDKPKYSHISSLRTRPRDTCFGIASRFSPMLNRNRRTFRIMFVYYWPPFLITIAKLTEMKLWEQWRCWLSAILTKTVQCALRMAVRRRETATRRTFCYRYCVLAAARAMIMLENQSHRDCAKHSYGALWKAINGREKAKEEQRAILSWHDRFYEMPRLFCVCNTQTLSIYVG